jgi:hypothetical protein
MRLAQTPGLKILVHLGNGLRDLELLLLKVLESTKPAWLSGFQHKVNPTLAVGYSPLAALSTKRFGSQRLWNSNPVLSFGCSRCRHSRSTSRGLMPPGLSGIGTDRTPDLNEGGRINFMLESTKPGWLSGFQQKALQVFDVGVGRGRRGGNGGRSGWGRGLGVADVEEVVVVLVGGGSNLGPIVVAIGKSSTFGMTHEHFSRPWNYPL